MNPATFGTNVALNLNFAGFPDQKKGQYIHEYFCK